MGRSREEKKRRGEESKEGGRGEERYKINFLLQFILATPKDFISPAKRAHGERAVGQATLPPRQLQKCNKPFH
jgi:hypothetical protein